MEYRFQPMDRKMMREMNQNMLLNLIRLHGPISRTDLKSLSGLSLGTIVGITSALLEGRLIVEVGMAESRGGRKAELLELHPQGAYGIGIELREHTIGGALLNLHGKIVYSETWSAPLRNNAEQAVEIIAEGVKAFIGRTQVASEKILGLGCAVSGPVNSRTGVSVDSWILGWHQVELGPPLSERLNMPVFVNNAVSSLASSEKLYGDGRRYQNFLLVTLGRGLGAAMVLNNDIFRGAQGLGAELGHIPIERHGRQCECGNRDCLEAYVADHGILNTYRELCALPGNVQAGDVDDEMMKEFVEKARQGDQQAREAFSIAGTYLGMGLATLVNLFNPECIIVDAGRADRLEFMRETMKESMEQHIFSQLGHYLQPIIERHTTLADWARGAGCLVLQHFFSSPEQKNEILSSFKI